MVATEATEVNDERTSADSKPSSFHVKLTESRRMTLTAHLLSASAGPGRPKRSVMASSSVDMWGSSKTDSHGIPHYSSVESQDSNTPTGLVLCARGRDTVQVCCIPSCLCDWGSSPRR
jgi:hypothetical protein